MLVTQWSSALLPLEGRISLLFFADRSPTAARAQPHLEEAIATACSRHCALVIRSLSDMTHSCMRAARLISQLARAGARFISVLDNIDTHGAEGEGIVRLAMAMCHVKRKPTRPVAIMGPAVTQVVNGAGNPPFGWQKCGEGTLPEPREQDIIGEIIRLRRSGLSYSAISKQLKQEGIRPRRAARWHPKVIMSIYVRHEDLRLIEHRRDARGGCRRTTRRKSDHSPVGAVFHSAIEELRRLRLIT